MMDNGEMMDNGDMKGHKMNKKRYLLFFRMTTWYSGIKNIFKNYLDRVKIYICIV
jgi:hypothetical protein